MPVYQGGKSRLGRRIHDVIVCIEDSLYDEDVELVDYFEPFVGMGGVMKHFGKDNDRNLYACDYNTDMIIMWRELQNGWIPPKKCSRAIYEKLKISKPSADRAFIGTVASWGGIWFQAYRLDCQPPGKDFIGEGYRGIMKIKDDMQYVNFLDPTSYESFSPSGITIYCDPPYLGNNLGDKKSLFQQFDHDKFWDIMRKWSVNNIVVISESIAPKDFKAIWKADSYVALNKQSTRKYKDNLYVHESIFSIIDNSTKNEIKHI